MANLNLNVNEITKDQDTQNRTINMALQDVQNWSATQKTKLALDYIEPQESANETTSSINFIPLRNFTKNVTLGNPLVTINFSLSLQGVGIIAIIVNGQQIDQAYFSSTGFAPFSHSKMYTLRSGSNSIQLQWAAKTGKISKGNTPSNPGNNFLQCSSHPS